MGRDFQKLLRINELSMDEWAQQNYGGWRECDGVENDGDHGKDSRA